METYISYVLSWSLSIYRIIVLFTWPTISFKATISDLALQFGSEVQSQSMNTYRVCSVNVAHLVIFKQLTVNMTK